MPTTLHGRFIQSGLMVALAGCLWPGVAWTQNPTDAGSVQRDIERARQEAPAPQAPQEALERPPAPKPGSTTVVLKSVKFNGNSVMTDAALQRALAPWIGPALDFAGVQSITQKVASVYEASGRLAMVTLGRQDITDGVVTIDILEARFAGARITGEPFERVRPERLLSIVDAHLRKGDLLDLRAMNRALLIMDDLPGVAVTGSLAAGTGTAETELLLEVADENRTSAMMQLDNTGGRAVGEEKILAQFGVVSPLGIGDQAQLTALATRASRYARAAYGWPLTASGLRAQTWVTGVDYRVISPELKALEAHGQSASAGAAVTWPFIRGREFNLNGKAAVEEKRMENFASGSLSSDYSSRNLQLELSATGFDRFAGGGANSAVLALTTGRIDLTGSPNEAADAQSARTAGGFSKWTLQLSRQQVLTKDLTFFAAASLQQAGRNLDSGERMSLGGPSGVRAYPGNEASGSSGRVINLELRQRASDRLSLIGFYDRGVIRVNAQTLSPSGQSLLGDAPNQYTLEGVGASVNWVSPVGLQVQLTLASPLGSHPSPSPAGTNQDGSRPGTRLLISTSYNW
jgi:hemolysin activation/secretion protein